MKNCKTKTNYGAHLGLHVGNTGSKEQTRWSNSTCSHDTAEETPELVT